MNAPYGPPVFTEAKNRRQQARAAGMNPNYWYPIELDERVEPGDVVEVKFWGKSFALFRGEDGRLACVENRCAHRQLKLSLGHVRGCNVVCPYHGWTYDGEGRVVDIPHELFGKPMPKLRVANYPLRVRYGLVWFFPGDPELADKVAMPEIPEIEGPDAWACVPIDLVYNCHHSMVIDNVSDFTHEYLHRKFEPFKDARLTRLETVGDKVFVEYDTKMGSGRYYKHFVPHGTVNTNHMRLCYDYPHQWSNTDDFIHHWCLVLPVDHRTTRTFFLFYYRKLQIPLLGVEIPKKVMTPMLKIANKILMRPLLREDGWAIQAEQEGYETHYNAPIAELNPAVAAFQDLTIRKWQEHLDTQDRLPVARRLPLHPAHPAAG